MDFVRNANKHSHDQQENKMKKLIRQLSLFAGLFLFSVGALCTGTSCHKKQDNAQKLNVVATIFPAYDWAQTIAKGSPSVNLTLLIKNGTDLHSYQPTAADIIKISTADLFIYVGGESDAWVDDALKNVQNPNMLIINLMNLLAEQVVQEEHVEGMQEDEVEDLGDIELDEHVWLSLNNAMIASCKIAECLEILDLENSTLYADNLISYIAQINELKSQYQTRLGSLPEKTLLVCDRFPFRYLADEFGLEYFAAFSGCSAETEASFQTVAFLTAKAKELGLKNVYVTESSDLKLAKTIIKNSGLKGTKIIKLDSMQSTTQKQSRSGKTYLGTMASNLAHIEQSLK